MNVGDVYQSGLTFQKIAPHQKIQVMIRCVKCGQVNAIAKSGMIRRMHGNCDGTANFTRFADFYIFSDRTEKQW
jgi:hypothetical protein